MKYLKMVGLLATAAVALMALAGTASAGSSLTSNEGSTPKFAAISANINMDLWASVTVKCSHSELKGQVEQHGVLGDAGGWISSWTFTGCNYALQVKKSGSLKFTSTNDVISSGAEIIIPTSVGSCVYTTSGTSIGTLTEGVKATLDINSSKVPRTGGNFLCGSSATWTGSFTFAAPYELYVH
jgi:hypothetical protein